MVEYKIKYFSIKRNCDEIKHFTNRQDFNALMVLLLGHKYIKDLKAYKYDRDNHKYKEIFI